MTNILNYSRLSTNLFIVTGLMVAFVMAMLISIPQAKAATYPDVLVGPNMTIGTTGQGVVVLQGLMSEMGYLKVPYGIPFGYYGSMTRDAVARYQLANNVSPPVGYFGPITKNAMYNDLSRHGWLSLLGW